LLGVEGVAVSGSCSVRVENTGHRTVHVDQVDFLILPLRQVFAPSRVEYHPNLPCELREGQGLTTPIEVEVFAEELVRQGFDGALLLLPRCIDAVSGQYTGSAFEFDIGRWRLEL
jgi:hypothetical protein